MCATRPAPRKTRRAPRRASARLDAVRAAPRQALGKEKTRKLSFTMASSTMEALSANLSRKLSGAELPAQPSSEL